MESSATQLDDIERNESDIVQDLAQYDLNDEPSFRRNYRIAKLKAKQQLALSDDSPFAHPDQEESIGLTESEHQKFTLDRAELLSKETSQLRDQLEFVKQRIQEIKSGQYQSNAEPANNNAEQTDNQRPSAVPRKPANFKEIAPRPMETKYRPLTGKADCPNCACDSRRRSVCDLCQEINLKSSSGTKSMTKPKETVKYNTYQNNDHDNKPIRPAKEKTLARVEKSDSTQNLRASINDVVVPGKVYTIGKSLNDKRTKLAQAIDELQLLIEQVKAKSNKLEDERKVVQLYKDQWKYGPSIGGPKSSSRERLGLNQENRSYGSRLDANLARDSKSLMGFKNIEPTLKLRQYNKPPVAARRSSTAKKSPVKVKLSASGAAVRSKSLESLRMVQNARAPPHVVVNENFQNGKASSEINLRKINEYKEEEEIEEKLEEGMEVEIDEDETAKLKNASKTAAETASSEGKVINESDESQLNDGKVARITWIPVFGETEIKTVKKPATRKIQVMKPSPQKSNNSDCTTSRMKTKPVQLNRQQLPRTTSLASNTTRIVTTSSSSNTKQASARKDRVLNEANRKLRFAIDLLEQEKNDSQKKNQLLISRRSPAALEVSREMPNKIFQDESSGLNKRTTESEQQDIRSTDLSENSRDELARIEEMVNEQQRLLNRLTQLQERQQVVSPVTVTCSSPCCVVHGHGNLGHIPHLAARVSRPKLSSARSLLVNTLRDRLNKSKLQLARKLEEEREKHQQLKLRVDSSLRKQSNLQYENELLKKSLGNCIDTCLKDISNTFESLSDTITDSVAGYESNEDHISASNQLDERIVASSNDDIASESSQMDALSHAAQFISDNKYLNQLKTHIKAIEQQRKSIFEELKKEKQKSMQLEALIKESRSEKNRDDGIKSRQEPQPQPTVVNLGRLEHGPTPGCSKDSKAHDSNDHGDSMIVISNETKQVEEKESNQIETDTQSNSMEFDDSQSSIELYRKYIESMSPDIESIRRERNMILSEFDNIKKMLSVMEQ